MRLNRTIAIGFLSAFLLVGASCHPSEPVGYVSVGSGSDSFTTLAAKLAVAALQQENYWVEDHSGYLSAVETRAAQINGEIDICWFSTADVWHKLLGHDQPIADPEELASAVRKADTKQGITWLSPAPYILRPGIAMRSTDGADKLTRMSELADYTSRHNPLSLCLDEEVASSSSGLATFQVAYHLNIPLERIVLSDADGALQALQAGQCNVALSYEAHIKNRGLVFLEDDRHILPVTGYALAVRQELISEYPDIQYILERVNSWLTPLNVTSWQQRLDAGESLEEIAQQFVDSQPK